MPRLRRAGLAALALVAGSGSALAFAAETTGPGADPRAVSAGRASEQRLVAEGRALFEEGCVSCHGFDARGVDGVAPSLHGAGAASADFYLSTGRMPLNSPGDQPVRAEPRYSDDEIAALVAYVGSLGGPPVPEVDPAEGDIQEGVEAFTTHCAGCHQVVARGGVVTGAFAPSLVDASPTQVAEAVRVGPYLMPSFPKRVIADDELASILRYVEEAKDPLDEGGWGIGNIGPIPEGMVAWLLAIVALLAVARLIGQRTR